MHYQGFLILSDPFHLQGFHLGAAHLALINFRQVSTTCSICRYIAVAITAIMLPSRRLSRDVYMKSRRMQNPSGLISGSRLITLRLHFNWSVKML